MGKLKTYKAAAKRVILTKRAVLKRKSGQDHFNSRESSGTRMGKRRDVAFDPLLVKTIRKAMPYA